MYYFQFYLIPPTASIVKPSKSWPLLVRYLYFKVRVTILVLFSRASGCHMDTQALKIPHQDTKKMFVMNF